MESTPAPTTTTTAAEGATLVYKAGELTGKVFEDGEYPGEFWALHYDKAGGWFGRMFTPGVTTYGSEAEAVAALAAYEPEAARAAWFA